MSRHRRPARHWIRNGSGSVAALLLAAALGTGAPADAAAAAAPTNGRIAVERDGEIYTMNADGTDPRRLTNNDASDSDPSFSRDGSTIAFVSGRDGDLEIYTMNADGSDQRNRSNFHDADDLEPSLSADGDMIAFTSWRDGNAEIYTMTVAGANATNLTNSASADWAPTFSPDDNTIAFARWDDSGDIDIYLITWRTLIRLTFTGNNAEPAFSPNGDVIAFTSWRSGNQNVFTMIADGTKQEIRTDYIGPDTAPAFSPDGKRIAFRRTFGDPKEGQTDHVYTMDADGGDETNITAPDEGSAPSWGGGGDADGCIDIDNQGGRDNDGDSLCDNWEYSGIDANADGTVDLALHEPPFNADRNRKDIFVEADWMMDSKPQPGTLATVTRAFRNQGVSLHAMLDEQVRKIPTVWFELPGPSYDEHFNSLKSGKPPRPGQADKLCDGYFGTVAQREHKNCANIAQARRLAFRYAIFGYDLAEYPGASGVAEPAGNDFLVTVASWNDQAVQERGRGFNQSDSRRLVEAATFMHELGHTLGLGHGGVDERGGADGTNCKPNYLSVMSYTLQFRDLDPDRPLDYSTSKLPDLVENDLNEPLGVRGPGGRKVVFGANGKARLSQTNVPIDWNDNRVPTDIHVDADVNYFRDIIGCNTEERGQTLAGRKDWTNLDFDFRDEANYQDHVKRTPIPEPELTADSPSR